MPSCRKSGRSYMNRGSRYTVKALHAGGLPDVANSLTVIKRLVYDERRLPLSELLNAMERNWEGSDELKNQVRREIPLYGNDDAAADEMMRKVFDDYTSIVEKFHETSGVLHPAGVSTFGREIQFAPFRNATAYGKRAGEYLAPNLSPTPGTDFAGITAVGKSYCKIDFTRTPNGCPLDPTLDSAFRRNPRRVELLAALLKSFIELEGWYLQVDVLDPAVLRQAQKEPDRFPNLAVRISGWSARFASLAPEWQELVINRIEQH
jgi:formate C-acetyltransferase